MSKPNFQTMNQAQLRAYVLSHRDDSEAFYALADRLRAKPGRKLAPEDIERLPEILEETRKDRESSDF